LVGLLRHGSGAQRLLRRHVAVRAHHHAGVGEARAAIVQARDPEVGDLRTKLAASSLPEENVGGLQIAMNDPRGVEVSHGGEDRKDDFERRGQGERLLPFETLGEALPLDELHDQKRRPVLDPEVEDVHDVRMTNLGGGATFPQKAGARDCRLGCIGGEGVEHLDRNPPAERLVVRLEDDPHPAAADRANELVVAQLGASAEGKH
jgi:hypothetical protein